MRYAFDCCLYLVLLPLATAILVTGIRRLLLFSLPPDLFSAQSLLFLICQSLCFLSVFLDTTCCSYSLSTQLVAPCPNVRCVLYYHWLLTPLFRTVLYVSIFCQFPLLVSSIPLLVSSIPLLVSSVPNPEGSLRTLCARYVSLASPSFVRNSQARSVDAPPSRCAQFNLAW